MTSSSVRLVANPFACLADDVDMVETTAAGSPAYPGGPDQDDHCDVSFGQFADLFKRVPLPRDNEQKDKFDIRVNFLLVDPIPLRFQDVPEYETRTQFGSVGWEALFSHLISLRDQVVVCDTVYLLVDNRDMQDLEATKQSIPHWPPAAAWWAAVFNWLVLIVNGRMWCPSISAKPLGWRMFIPRGLGLLSWQVWLHCTRTPTSILR